MSEERSWDLNKVKEYVQKITEYDEQIKLIQEQKREWSKEFIEEHDLPKKEIAQALSIFKKNVDIEVVTEILSTVKNE